MKNSLYCIFFVPCWIVSCKPSLTTISTKNEIPALNEPQYTDPCNPKSQPIVRSPKLTLDRRKFETNISRLKEIEKNFEIEILPIVKAASGRDKVYEILLRSGMVSFGDSRLQNLCRWKSIDEKIKTTLIRPPALVDAEVAQKLSDRIVITNLETAKSIESANNGRLSKQSKEQDVILFIEQGDLRDGFYPPQDVPKIAKQIDQLSGVRLVGIGSHLGSLNGAETTTQTLSELSDMVTQVEQVLGRKLEVVSSGNSATLAAMQRNTIIVPENIKGKMQIRVGFTLFFGKDGSDDSTNLPGFEQNVLRLYAQVIEVFEKPAHPWGKIGTNAFGNSLSAASSAKQTMTRAILNIGQLDFETAKLKLRDPKLRVLEASSDHLVVDVSEADRKISTGDEIEIEVDYSTAIHAFQSDHIYLEVSP